MKLLLDTHAFLWWVSDDPRLSDRAHRLVGDGVNEVFFSAVSAWEIVVKTSLGRLELQDDPDSFISGGVQANAFEVLPIHLNHALWVYQLPDLHRDPFDRMLVAQAKSEELAILTADRKVAQYPVDTIW
jgi:PIN domain nuclease of toxin-antitoxin system